MNKLIGVILIVNFLNLTSCNHLSESRETLWQKAESPLDILNKFYTEYYKELIKMPMELDKIELIREKYCSPSLIEHLEKLELDYDPFFKAQDIEDEFLETMEIKKDESIKDKDVYVLCYLSNYKNRKICINLVVRNIDDNLKIDEVY